VKSVVKSSLPCSMKRTLFASTLFAFTIAATASTAASTAAAPIRVRDVWSRPATGTAVIYATIHNASSGPDRLIGATSPLATHVDLHESAETKMPAMSMPGGMGGMPMNGSMMSRKTLTAIPIPAGGTTSLKPGGYHLMLDLRHDLMAGERVPLRLHFARAGWIAVTATVRPIR
jgi:copper(I)-binding protein